MAPREKSAGKGGVNLPFPRYKRKGQCLRCGKCCLPEDCPHYSYDEKKRLATCLIYKKASRPSHCEIFPGNPPILYKACGYYFIDRWEDDKMIKAGETI